MVVINILICYNISLYYYSLFYYNFDTQTHIIKQIEQVHQHYTDIHTDTHTNTHIQSSLGSHKNIITYIDSSINRMPNNIREVLILMLYYKG